ncbi:MAG: bifunctional 3-phosphoshikimate 1-carboxyvinyltransferase/cytidylate kinase [Roseateles asaccharophilus]|uniref:Multifunctional fusion protein n=1 Tax=Roseateles asaccharophilus TaxID=582607 RepID=A0A4R6NDZ3_9BURK|nr:bifunctional 3-phosphoshikimate 1-carboxyvinyltransferase/cytidylate kinase [Roseateles asaccharophilus]MDN3543529.1 bifunctional 3-phosphoshikimate 1-carboxyvinyltransferase/cytidylate kinase [Roseateles asaccharophilus]TDP12093.1 3-phosphoshikimate 1-carboxyvinyltransferase [Roseateles asaccharophilus]
MFKTPFLDLPPLRSAAGTVRLPGSKSISNRVLLLAGLSEGQTLVHDLLDSDDTRVMLAALRQLGCQLEQEPLGPLKVTGIGGRLGVQQAKLFLGNAGTAMRPLTAALALLAATQGGEFELSGVPRMHERPIGDLVDALRALGCPIDCLAHEGYPPLRLRGPAALSLDTPVKVRGDVSSQFLTALLLALPLVAERDIEIEVIGELISKPYIHITLELLKRFGIEVRRDADWQRFTIPAGSRYRSPGAVHVEGDASSASYFVALGAIAAAEHPIRIEGVGSSSLQGDVRFIEAAQAMGAEVRAEANALEVRRGAWPLKALDLDCNHIPDAAMTLAVMALYADGPSTLRNIASWRVKETDRIAAMAAELQKLGARVEEGPDWIRVHPLGAGAWKPAAIRTYDDHRVAMCFSLVAFNALVSERPVPVRILEPHCVAKTFPDYFETLFDVVQARPEDIPVITIDGPTASGKGTLADEVARALGYWVLDSGALYRATGLAASRAGVDLDDGAAVAAVAAGLDLHFEDGRAFLDEEDISDALRQEATGLMASRVAVHLPVRAALHQLQLDFRRLPGLVADGRDMGTAIFPAAPLKVFLSASAATRAERRYKQLISKGIPANIEDLRADLEARDARDKGRSASPLQAAPDAFTLDNSAQTIEESRDLVLAWWQERGPFGPQG